MEMSSMHYISLDHMKRAQPSYSNQSSLTSNIPSLTDQVVEDQKEGEDVSQNRKSIEHS